MSWDSRASNHRRTAKNIIGRHFDLMGFIPDFYHLIPPAMVRLYPYYSFAISAFSALSAVNFRRIYPALLRDSFPSDDSGVYFLEQRKPPEGGFI